MTIVLSYEPPTKSTTNAATNRRQRQYGHSASGPEGNKSNSDFALAAKRMPFYNTTHEFWPQVNW